MDLHNDNGNSATTLIQGHAIYMGSMLLEALNACITEGFKISVPLDAIKLQLDGCLGIGWGAKVKIKGHSFIRQFTLKGTARMTVPPSGK